MQKGTFRGFEVELRPPGIAVITLNQPERLNGTTQEMKRDLVELLLESQMDDTVRVVVITGSGRAFCAGDDITGRPRDSAAQPGTIRQHTNMARSLLRPPARVHSRSFLRRVRIDFDRTRSRLENRSRR